MNQMVDLIKNHMSIRKYQERLIDRDTVNTIIQCAQTASTSSHFQAYTIIEVQDKIKREMLSEIGGGQDWVIEAPLVLLFCGDLYRGNKYFEHIDKKILSNTECFTVAVIDAALAAQNAMLSAESMGLGGVIVGGIRNNVEMIHKEFKLPEMVFPLFAICLGYPDQIPGIKPRLPQEEIHKINFYDRSKGDELIAQYNDTVTKYYDERTQGAARDRWTERCGRLLMAKPRYEVGHLFRKIGLLKE